MAASKGLVLELCGHEVVVTNPDKIVFPEAGHTKLDLVRYYLSVAEGALRGVAGRPMVLKRFVKGIGEEAVFQKRAPDKRPDWVEVVELHYASGTSAAETVVRDEAGLAWVVNLGCVDLNPHPVLAEDLDHPVELRIDLDPMPGVTWPQIVDVALVVREVLGDAGLSAWPKTSGSRGLHVYAPLEAGWSYPQVRLAAQTVAREVERRVPALATSRWWKEERSGRVRRLQPERQGPHGGLRVVGARDARRAGVRAAALGRGADRRPAGLDADDGARSGTPTATRGPAWTPSAARSTGCSPSPSGSARSRSPRRAPAGGR